MCWLALFLFLSVSTRDKRDEINIFVAGDPCRKEYPMDALQVEPSEFELIKYPERGTCLYRCGNERYLLQVIAPDYKAAIFGKAGGR